jgi:hypothetical protein
MRKIYVTVLIGLMLTVSGGIIRAGQFEDGVAAYQRVCSNPCSTSNVIS